MKCSVVVATFRRPESLARCLDGLERQTRVPDEVLLVVQHIDDATHAFLQARAPWPVLRVVRTDAQGVVRQYNAGLEASSGEIVAFIDDDAVARPEWLLRVEKHFEDNSRLGGVGGRDFVVEDGQRLEGTTEVVGIVQWYGRVVGNHHLALPGVRRVSILKGVNMAFRRAAVGAARFDTDLRGSGAQTCCDMGISLDVERQGWQLIYDPEVAVDHFPATRFDADKRKAPEETAIANHSFNLYLTLRRHLRPGLRRSMALLWAYSIGTVRTPGWIRGMVARMQQRTDAMRWRALARQAWRDAKEVSSGRKAKW